MKHLLTAYLVLTLLAGTVSLLVLFLVNRRLRNRVLLYYIGICVGLSASVLHNLLLFYLGINVYGTLTPALVAFMFANLPLSYMMQAMIPLMVHRLYRVSWEKPGNAVALAIIAIQGCFVFTPLYARYSADTGRLVFGPAYIVENAAFISFILYALSAGFLLRKRLGPELRKIVRTFLVLVLLSLPGFVHDQLYFAVQPTIDSLPVTFIFFPLFFLALSVANIVYGLRFLSSAHDAPATVATNGVPGQAASERLDSLSRDYALSEREKEVARLVIEGLGNKQIAGQLGISAKTVNNHVYNLYQKLGINSRFELMARLKAD